LKLFNLIDLTEKYLLSLLFGKTLLVFHSRVLAGESLKERYCPLVLKAKTF